MGLSYRVESCRRRPIVALLGAAALWVWAASELAEAQEPPNPAASEAPPTAPPKTSPKEEKEEEHKPADPDTGTSTLSPDTLGLLPNPYEHFGIKFTLSYVGETLGNLGGGLKQGLAYDGRLNGAIDLDFRKLAGWSGLTFHANAFQIHGRGLSRDYIGNLLSVSSIEALSTTRLYEAWFEQKFSGDKISLRFGQLAADTEFVTSKYTDVFITSTFGWPGLFALDLPSGGPSPPLAAVGARLKAELNAQVTLLAAVFNGDPAGPGEGDPQARNRYGVNFRVTDPPLLIGEFQYAWSQEKDPRAFRARPNLEDGLTSGPLQICASPLTACLRLFQMPRRSRRSTAGTPRFTRCTSNCCFACRAGTPLAASVYLAGWPPVPATAILSTFTPMPA